VEDLIPWYDTGELSSPDEESLNKPVMDEVAMREELGFEWFEPSWSESELSLILNQVLVDFMMVPPDF